MKQEPAEWMKPHPKCDSSCLHVCTEGFTKFPLCVKPKLDWVGLTEADIYELMDFDNYEDQFDFAYAIEAKLKEKNSDYK